MKIIFVFIGLVLSCTIGKAQMPNLSMVSGNQKFVEDAVKDGLFIVNQKYCLVDDSLRHFGSDNRDYFGQTISLGVKANDGYIVDLRASAPQKFDPNFNAYADRYTARIKKTEYCMIGDTLFKPLSYSETETDTLVAERIFYQKNNVFENKGFMVDNANGDKSGWLVWVLSDDKEYSLQIVRGNLKFIASSTEYSIEKVITPENKTIVGGVFVVPQNTAIGQVTFKLAGVIGKNAEQWFVVRIPGNTGLSSVAADLTPLNEVPSEHGASVGPASEGLTPIEDNSDRTGKKKKRRR